MSARLSRLALIFGVLGLASTSPAQARDVHALVIGNGTYDTMMDLPLSDSDARAVGQKFEALGFQTTVLVDATHLTMRYAVADLAEDAKDSDLVVLFFTGHGWSDGRASYVIPKDARSDSAHDLRFSSLDITRDLIEPLEDSGTGTIFAMFDACRDQPFQRPQTRGFGPIDGKAPANLYVLYGSAPGKCVFDKLPAEEEGAQPSVFTRHILSEMSEGLTLDDYAARVMSETFRTAREGGLDQRPYLVTSTSGPVCFTQPCAVDVLGDESTAAEGQDAIQPKTLPKETR